MNFLDFCTKILCLKSLFDFSVTSWIRSQKRNEAVGGKDDSLHLVGLACDVVLEDPSQADALIYSCKRLGLVAIKYVDCIHIQIPYE